MFKLALFGSAIGHSASPLIHQAFAAAHGISLQYQLIEADKNAFKKAFNDFLEHGQGGNITLPHKQNAFLWLEELSLSGKAHIEERAQKSATVNTFWKENNRIHADNTDGIGLMADFNRLEINITGKNILILGAGGAAAAIIPALLEKEPKSIHICNRTLHHAEKLAASHAQKIPLTAITQDTLNETTTTFDLIIQATSAPLQGILPSLPVCLLTKHTVLYDLCYHKDKPSLFQNWVHQVSQSPCFDGYGMLVYQAAFAFERWFAIFPHITAKLLIDEHRLRCHLKKP